MQRCWPPESEDKIALLRRDLVFLERLGAELTRPVLPRSAHIDYLPTQYLCELIKDSGFDGVKYRSSVGDGVNVALFDPQRVNCRSVTRWRITKVEVAIDAHDSAAA